MSLQTLLFGRPLATEEEQKEQIGPFSGARRRGGGIAIISTPWYL